MTKDDTAEARGVYAGDEAELARMGYKQELKCVHPSCPMLFPWILTITQTRFDLGAGV